MSALLGAPVQVDIGFGDVVHPQPQQIAFPGLIEDLPEPADDRAFDELARFWVIRPSGVVPQ